jgi:two-component system, OmpR family, sensor kinase
MTPSWAGVRASAGRLRPAGGRWAGRLRHPRLPQLRARVLAGVVLITLIALAGFDIAAVTALRGYLLNQTDSSLTAVSNQIQGPRLHELLPGAKRPAPPPAFLPPPVLQRLIGQFYVAFVHGNDKVVIFPAGPDVTPRATAANWYVRGGSVSRIQTVPGGGDQVAVRLRSVHTDSGTLLVSTSLAHVNNTVGHLVLILIIGSAAAALLVFGGVGLVVRRGLRPIEAMAAQADRITAGDLTDRVQPQDSRSEVGRLGTALNGMLTRIEASVAEREASQEATRRFFADASHELRNPLASLRANAELYQQGALSSRPQVDQAMHRIAAEAQRMSSLVDDMLRLARLDQHPGQEHEPVDLTALVQDCVERAQVTGAERAWHSHVAPGLTVNGDAELLRRAVDNLLANVRAHTAAGTTATITATGSADLVTVEVSDDGPGVPAGQLPHIFDRFYRAGPQAHRPGSGLGLAVVAAVAAAHEGTAGAALNDPHGLRITLTLPGRPEPDPGPAGPQASAGEGGERPAEPGQPAVTGAGRARPSPAPRPCRAAAAGSPRGSSAWPGR